MEQHGAHVCVSVTAGLDGPGPGLQVMVWTPWGSADVGRRGSRLRVGFRAALCVKLEGPNLRSTCQAHPWTSQIPPA